MKITFNRGYICCGCDFSCTRDNAELVYKRSCICKACYDKLMPYSKDSYHEEREGMEFLAAMFRYKDIYRKIFLDFKFNSQRASGNLLGMAMERMIKERDAFYDYDYIVPVPVSRHRKNRRGYNQSEVLAEYISKGLDIPLANCLKRIKHSPSQSTVSQHMRSENVNNAFAVTKQINGENIILFDDIYTTGSTAAECVNTLKRAGAGKVCVVVGGYNSPTYIDRTIYL